jgi:hypothetical protein
MRAWALELLVGYVASMGTALVVLYVLFRSKWFS